jgi:hypothetical protein
MIVLTISDLNSQAIEAILDDELFYIIIDWNDSGQYWEMGIRNSSYQTLVDGIAMVPNYPLLWQFRYMDMPLGDLQLVRVNNDNGPPTRDDILTIKYQLVYITRNDILGINALAV